MTRASLIHRAHLGGECRKPNPDPQRIAELRELIREAVLTEWVERELAEAPPPSQATRERLAALLSGTTEPTA